MVTPKQVLVVTGRDDDVCTYQTAVAQCAKPGIETSYLLTVRATT